MPMRKQHDFSKARRARQVPDLAMLQARPKGKTRITLMLDDDVLAAGVLTVDEATLRRVIREELSARLLGAAVGEGGFRPALQRLNAHAVGQSAAVCTLRRAELRKRVFGASCAGAGPGLSAAHRLASSRHLPDP
jgi:hypothetical protein